MNEHEQLNEVLSQAVPVTEGRGAQNYAESAAPSPDRSNWSTSDFSQWQIGANGTFRPASKTAPRIDPGVYAVDNDQFGLLLIRKPVLCDEIVDLPDTATQRVMAVMKRFWGSRKRYQDHGLIYKRGVILWGPPGSGKTVTIHLLMRELISHGGIVLLCGHPSMMADMLQVIRRIEPDRPIIVVMEDIDETISSYGERSILMMLDGETQVDNVVYLATTNYPERLGARIINRPSRFDDRVLIAMPTLNARLSYLQRATANGSELDADTVQRWAEETEGLSIAHLRELVAAVMCLDQPYEDVLERLRCMAERPKDIEGFAKRSPGLLMQSAAGQNRPSRMPQ